MVLLNVSFVQAQESSFSKFKKLSGPEKRWALFHPFVAKKAQLVSVEVLNATDSIYKNNVLDQYQNGGQVDAFRHGYWMARLAKEIGKRKAISLGKAHEKGNKKDFKKGKLEEGLLPDKVSSEMDLHNNAVGAEISAGSKLEAQKLVISQVQQGEFQIIKRDANDNFLDQEGNIIPDEKWQGTWENDRCLVPSNWPQ